MGDILPGKSVHFSLESRAVPGYSEGLAVAEGAGGERISIRQPRLCPASFGLKAGIAEWKAESGQAKFTASPGTGASIKGKLMLTAGGKPCPLLTTAPNQLAARVPGGIFLLKFGQRHGLDDPELQCEVVPDIINPHHPKWLDMEIRIAVTNPKVMFRPHLDWYRTAKGANVTQTLNGHNSATRMLCIETDKATVSLVPDTDNMTWGFTPRNEMTVSLEIPLAPYDPLNQGIWRPIQQASARFRLLLPIRKGDWWDSSPSCCQGYF